MAMEILPESVIFRHLALLAPMVGENNNCDAGGIMILVVEVGTPPHQLPEVNQLVLTAPVQVPVVPQLIIRVDTAVAPGQLPVPVTVSVAIKEPPETAGINVASAGSECCIQVPIPVPPDQILAVPVADEPVMTIGVTPLQLFIAGPADARDKPATLTVTLAQVELLHDVPQRA